MTPTAIAFPRESRSYSPCATHAREDRPPSRTLPFSRFAVLIPRRRIGFSRFSQFVSKIWQNDTPRWSFVYMHKRSLPSFSSLSLRRRGPRRAAPGSYRRPAGIRNATGGKASAHTTGPGFGKRRAAGLRNATKLRRTRPGQVSARRLLN